MTLEFASRDALLNQLAATQPYHKHLQKELSQVFVNEFVDAYLSRLDALVSPAFHLSFQCPVLRAHRD